MSLLAIIGFASLISRSVLAMDLPKQMIRRKEYNPKLESVLGELAEKYLQSRALAQDFASQRGIAFQDDRVTAILVPPVGKDASVIDRVDLLSYGAIVEASSQHLIRAKIPIFTLEKVADNVSGISYIRLPYKPFLADKDNRIEPMLSKFSLTKENESEIISEGVSLTDAVVYHNSGYEGQNTKIAIIGALGFVGWEDAIQNGELPFDVITKDFSGTGLATGGHHGTKIAEIVHDMAPKAKLYLIKIGDNEVDLENAKDYCVAEGLDIINHSWVWYNTNFTDGTGFICDLAKGATSQGLLWVNAAGNSAQSHYQGFFTDTDNDDWHEFASGNETNGLQDVGSHPVDIFLTWDCWPVTDQDYDLYLLDSAGNIIERSENVQSGTQPPTESIHIEHPDGTYHIAIRKVSTIQDNELKLFINYSSLQYQTVEHSVLAPADAIEVIAVGAISWSEWETGPQKAYSSQGPTNDGRIKPDICGPTDVSTFTSRRSGGTSVATPHVAGAAALILSKYPDCIPSQLQATLETWAVDMGIPGKDNIYGSGRLRLLLKSPVNLTLENLRVYPNPFRSSKGHTQVIFDELSLDARIRIFTISGELIADSNELEAEQKWIWNLKNREGREVARGIYIYLATNGAGDKKKGKIAVID